MSRQFSIIEWIRHTKYGLFLLTLNPNSLCRIKRPNPGGKKSPSVLYKYSATLYKQILTVAHPAQQVYTQTSRCIIVIKKTLLNQSIENYYCMNLLKTAIASNY